MSYLNYYRSKNYWYISSNIVTLATLFLLTISVLGYRFEIFSVLFSLLTLTKYAIYSSLLALVLSFITFGSMQVKNKSFSSKLNVLLNIFINVSIVSYFFISFIDLKSNPMINDISTNYDEFIDFKINNKQNLLQDNHIFLQKYGGFMQPSKAITSLQIKEKNLEDVFNKSKIVLNNMGLKITYSDFEEGLIEAVDSSFWYGFKDDIVIRMEKLISDEIKVDVRSASRTGKSDFGVNSKRIKNFLIRLSSHLKD